MQLCEFPAPFARYLDEPTVSGLAARYLVQEPPVLTPESIVVPAHVPPGWTWDLRVLGSSVRVGFLELWALVRECPPWSWVIVVVVGVVVGWSWWCSRLAEQRAVDRACWLEIIAPAQPPGEGAEALPRALAGLLAVMPTRGATSRVARRLAVEMITDGGASRMGVWLLGGWDATRVAAAITQALPGARVCTTDTPGWRFAGPVAGRELRPLAGPWTVLVAPSARGTSSGPVESNHESLRSVFTALADSPVPAALQLVIAPAAGHGRPANETSSGLGAGRMWIRAAPALLTQGMGRILLWSLSTVMIVLSEASSFGTRNNQQPGKSTRRGGSALDHKAGLSNGPWAARHHSRGECTTDPVLAAWEREVGVKESTRPLLHATLRVATLTNSPAADGAGAQLASDVAIGYALALPRAQIRPCQVRRFDRALRARRPGWGFYVTLAELGALWHLPAEPARYRLPEPAARNRSARPDVPRLPTTHT